MNIPTVITIIHATKTTFVAATLHSTKRVSAEAEEVPVQCSLNKATQPFPESTTTPRLKTRNRRPANSLSAARQSMKKFYNTTCF